MVDCQSEGVGVGVAPTMGRGGGRVEARGDERVSQEWRRGKRDLEERRNKRAPSQQRKKEERNGDAVCSALC